MLYLESLETSFKSLETSLTSLETSLTERLARIEVKVDNMSRFVATGNEDIMKKMQKA